MAYIYAGILGPLAFVTSLARGLVHGGGAQSTLFAAWCSLLVFSAIGLVVGWLASQTVEQSVVGRVSAELAAAEESETSAV